MKHKEGIVRAFGGVSLMIGTMYYLLVGIAYGVPPLLTSWALSSYPPPLVTFVSIGFVIILDCVVIAAGSGAYRVGADIAWKLANGRPQRSAAGDA